MLKVKNIRSNYQFFYFLFFYISFYISRYQCFQKRIFRTSLNLICKNNFVTIFPLMISSKHPHPLNGQTPLSLTKANCLWSLAQHVAYSGKRKFKYFLQEACNYYICTGGGTQLFHYKNFGNGLFETG